jgi:hypothetical protein
MSGCDINTSARAREKRAPWRALRTVCPAGPLDQVLLHDALRRCEQAGPLRMIRDGAGWLYWLTGAGSGGDCARIAAGG